MKKSSLIITTFALASFAFGGAKVQAEVSSTHTSENKINFTAGEGVVTPPVDPTNPDNPNVPNPIDETDPEGNTSEGFHSVFPPSVLNTLFNTTVVISINRAVIRPIAAPCPNSNRLKALS